MKFDLNDFLIEAKSITNILSRSKIDPYYRSYGSNNSFLPIITAPMDTVVSSKNMEIYLNNKINVCLPRGESNKNLNNVFESYSLKDFNKKYLKPNKKIKFSNKRILIDIANGHMSSLIKAVIDSKNRYGNELFLMVGNIANPETYKILSESGADAIRVGIGNGGGCLTTQQLGIGYPIGSLIKECYEKSLSLNNPALIIADGGMKSYSDIIKSLALGADFVMLGNIFNKSLESSGNCYFRGIKINDRFSRFLYKKGFKIYKKFRGMSTKEVQKKWGNKTLKTSEGVIRYRKVEYTLDTWVNNFTDYLKSAMSYTGSETLYDFTGKVNINLITNESINRFKK